MQYKHRLDLNDLIIPNPYSTFFARIPASTDIHNYTRREDSIIAIDKSIPPDRQHVLVAILDGSYTLLPFDRYRQLARQGRDISTWGVVTAVITQL